MAVQQLLFPADFEKLVKQPRPANGQGYPYVISARDLMSNLNTAALLVDDTEVDGLKLKETRKGNQRILSLDGGVSTSTTGSSLPEGVTENDTLRFNGSEWVILPAPSASGTYMLGSVEGVLQWMTTSGCS